MRVIILVVLFTMFVCVFIAADELEVKNDNNKIIFNIAFNIGTFSAGENEGGSVSLGTSLSLDWIPNERLGLSYGIESGLLGGKKRDNIIYGIPAIFRIGWHPYFLKNDKYDLFILAKLGWGFGIWDSNLDENSTPNGVVCGFNFGGNYYLTQKTSLYAELGYNYYGIARNSNYPEYPLGYGSGKAYTSLGFSFKM